MPADGIDLTPHENLMTADELMRLVCGYTAARLHCSVSALYAPTFSSLCTNLQTVGCATAALCAGVVWGPQGFVEGGTPNCIGAVVQ